MELLRKWASNTSINFPLIDANTPDFSSTLSLVVGDSKIIKDEGVAANTTNLPTHVSNGYYNLRLTAIEMIAERIIILIQDTGTKTWKDQSILVSTFGNANAQHEFDLNAAHLKKIEFLAFHD